MTFFELFLIGIGLSMDAFAVSICKGLSMQKIDKKYTLCIGLFFGGFQALMPLTGYLLGSRFSGYIERFDHWIAFVLLALIGFNMIKESREEEEEEEKPYAGVNFKELLILAVATSIDALAVGVTFAFLQVNIVPAITIIGCTTFVISIAGVYVGNVFGSRYKSRAELTGGVILILIGLKILLEHFGCDRVLIKREIISHAARVCRIKGTFSRERRSLNPYKRRQRGRFDRPALTTKGRARLLLDIHPLLLLTARHCCARRVTKNDRGGGRFYVWGRLFSA